MKQFKTNHGYIGSGIPCNQKGEEVSYKDATHVRCPFCRELYPLKVWVNLWTCENCGAQ